MTNNSRVKTENSTNISEKADISGLTITFRTMPQDLEILLSQTKVGTKPEPLPPSSFQTTFQTTLQPPKEISFQPTGTEATPVFEKPIPFEIPEKEEKELPMTSEINIKDIKDLYQEAKSLYKRRFFQEAITKLNELLTIKPHHWRAKWLLRKIIKKYIKYQKAEDEARLKEIEKIKQGLTVQMTTEKEERIKAEEEKIKAEEIRKKTEEKLRKAEEEKYALSEEMKRVQEALAKIQQETENKVRQEMQRELSLKEQALLRLEKQIEQLKLEKQNLEKELESEHKALEKIQKETHREQEVFQKEKFYPLTRPEVIPFPSALQTAELSAKKENVYPSPTTYSWFKNLLSFKLTKAILSVLFLAAIFSVFIYFVGLYNKTKTSQLKSIPSASQIILPPSPFAINEIETIILSVGQKKNLYQELLKLSEKSLNAGTFLRVLIKFVNQDGQQNYASLVEFIDSLQIVFPPEILTSLKDEYTLFFYSQKETPATPFLIALGKNKLGLVVPVKNKENLSTRFNSWEATMARDLDALFLGKKIAYTKEYHFVDIFYRDAIIRSLSLPNEYSSINYSFYKDKLIITTSLESIKAVIDQLSTP